MVRWRVCDAAIPPASALLDAVLAEYDAVAGRALQGGPLTTPAEFAPPGGAYVVGFAADSPACGGGIRALDEHCAELKRMYVVPQFRGQGLARALLAVLEDAARERGYRAVRLDSQDATWPLYAAAGYEEIDDYNGNPHAHHWGEKLL